MVFAATAPGAATQISQKATQANSDQVENWPRTLETAVSAILAGMKAKDKRILKSFQKEDLIRYHFGWGTGIRNSMGLWRGNEALMRSCAKKIGKDRIHPDTASMVIIEAVWSALNADLQFTVFSTLEPDAYFQAIAEYATNKCTRQANACKALPQWVYLYSLGHKARADFLEAAWWILEKRQEIAFPYALIYTALFDPGESSRKFIEGNLKDHSRFNIPVKALPDMFGSWKESPLLKKTGLGSTKQDAATYRVIETNYETLGLTLLGEMHGREFENIATYYRFRDEVESSKLLMWRYTPDMDAQTLSAEFGDHLMLLKLLMLSKKFIHFDHGSSGLPLLFRPDAAEAITIVSKHLGTWGKTYDVYPYPAPICPAIRLVDDAVNRQAVAGVNTLSNLAGSIDTQHLYTAITKSAYHAHVRRSYSSELEDYRAFAGFILVTQNERLLRSIEHHRLFETVRFYVDERFTWPMSYYLASLLVQIDAVRSKEMVVALLDDDSINSKNGLVSAVVGKAFHDYQDFIYDWYFKIQDMPNMSNPHIRDIILHELQRNGAEPRKLYNKILKDPRFKVYDTTLKPYRKYRPNCRND